MAQIPMLPNDPSQSGVMNPQFRAGEAALAGESFPSRLAIGSGRQFADWGRRAGQIAGVTPQSDIDEAARRDAALTSDPAAALGQIGTGAIPWLMASRYAPVAAIPGAVGRAAASLSPLSKFALAGAAQGASNPVTTGESTLGNAALGAGAGAVLGKLGQGAHTVLSGMWDSVSPEVQAVMANARKWGIPLHTGQVTPGGQTAASKMGRMLPFAGTEETDANQVKALTRAIGATFGQPGENLDKSLASALGTGAAAGRGTIGAMYDDVASRNPVHFTVGDFDQMHDSVNNTLGLTDVEKKTLHDSVDHIYNTYAQSGGQMPGDVWKSLDSQIGKAGFSSTNPLVRDAYYQINDTLKGALRRTANNPADMATLDQADQYWANAKSASRINTNQTNGLVTPQALNTAFSSTAKANAPTRTMYKFGQAPGQAGTPRGDLGEVADVSKQMLQAPPQLPTPTAGSSLLSKVKENPLLTLAGAGLAGHEFGLPVNEYTAGAAAAIPALGATFGRAANSPTRVFGINSPFARALDTLTPLPGAIGAPAVRAGQNTAPPLEKKTPSEEGAGWSEETDVPDDVKARLMASPTSSQGQ